MATPLQRKLRARHRRAREHEERVKRETAAGLEKHRPTWEARGRDRGWREHQDAFSVVQEREGRGFAEVGLVGTCDRCGSRVVATRPSHPRIVVPVPPRSQGLYSRMVSSTDRMETIELEAIQCGTTLHVDDGEHSRRGVRWWTWAPRRGDLGDLQKDVEIGRLRNRLRAMQEDFYRVSHGAVPPEWWGA